MTMGRLACPSGRSFALKPPRPGRLLQSPRAKPFRAASGSRAARPGRPYPARSVACLSSSRSSSEQLSHETLRADDLTVSELKEMASRLMNDAGRSDPYGQGSPAKSALDLARLLRSSTTSGVTNKPEAVQKRRDQWGANTLPERERLTFLQLIWESLQDVTLYALMASGLFSVVTGQLVGGESSRSGTLEGLAILGSVVVVSLVTAVNDYQKESQFQELNAVKEDVQVRVVRDSLERTVSVFDLVVGDLLVIEGGDILPVDVVLVDGSALKVDESHLTGESDEVIKEPMADPLVVSGSKVNEGSARGLVIAVGSNSQSGVISLLTAQGGPGFEGDAGDQSSKGMRKQTMLVEKLDSMAGDIGRLGLVAAVATTVLMSASFTFDTFLSSQSPWSWSYLNSYLDFVISGITVLVVAVPEGLPLAVTIALAFSVKQMLAEKNLVRQLDACETMGCATTILTDKTGTLTQNQMTAVALWIAGEEHHLPENPNYIASPQLGLPDMATFTFTEDLSMDFDSEDMRVAVPVEGGEWTPKFLPIEARRALCNGIALNTTAAALPPSVPGGPSVWTGSRTEGALLEVVYQAGFDAFTTRAACDTRTLLPFSSKRKCMASLAYDPDRRSGTLHVKGAPDLLLSHCTGKLLGDGSVVPLTDEEREQLRCPFGNKSLRVLCIAQKYMTELPCGTVNCSQLDLDEEELIGDLTLVAMVGIEDPIRPEVPKAVAQCQQAGITVRMLTGDNAATAASIARQSGILSPDACEEASVMVAQDFMDLVTRPDGSPDPQRFQELWPQIRVLARCSPVHKHDIVRKLHGAHNNGPGHRREVLAMTGDGTNDAPALRAADVGFAMNSGTSIAKSASDIVIMDDSFCSLVSAVRWGRNVYVSITKFLQFQLTINIVAVAITVLGAAVLNKAPLGAVQMLWVNLIMDSLASLALATEPPTDAMLKMQPFSAQAPLLTNKVLKHIAGQAAYQLAVLIGLLSLSGPLLDLSMDNPAEQTELFTLVFNSLVMMSLFNQLNCRRVQDEPNVLEGILHNRFFLYIIGSEALLQFLIVQHGGELFKTAALGWQQWGMCMGFGAGTLLVHRLLSEVPDPAWSPADGESSSAASTP